ncbi:ABC transporter ATP-binding protein [Natrarchaeobius halalkaliphilus]|uniref:ABC transporter ATP-binding protein n=1 Tax=Natrarchaeobius halalkaliphilus TaxID=1679091 RepID=UPI00243693FA|nr:ABC transporter ATP-binding protein [Natrarchaeobius halalkaliphilus]
MPPFRSRPEWTGYRERAVALMERVGIADAENRVDDYPHEFSGGMRQRVMLAIALAGTPRLLLADEPTTALDTTTQAQILARIRDVREAFDTAVVMITHDLGVVAETCDRVVVLYGGAVVEAGPTDRVLEDPSHPYTRGLLDCLIQDSPRRSRLPTIDGTVHDRVGPEPGCSFASRCEHATPECRTTDPPTVDIEDGHRVACGERERVRRTLDRSGCRETPSAAASLRVERDPSPAFDGETDETPTGPVVELESVSKAFDTTDSMLDRLWNGPRLLRAVDGVDLAVQSGETVGIVGESASGKSTLARLLTGLCEPTDGEVRLDGTTVGTVDERTHEQLTDVGVVFQNARSSINPRLTAQEAITEPLRESGWDDDRCQRRVAELLDLVDLHAEYADRYAHQLSGGQLQRVTIARAIALSPRLIVLDEPVSGLDVSIRAKVLNLLMKMQDRLGMAVIVISHHLDVVTHLADRVLVMYLGRVMERGPAEVVSERPGHPYTEALYDAIPSIDGTRTARPLEGDPPSPLERSPGCPFASRCPRAEPMCETDDPPTVRVGAVRSTCHVATEVADRNSSPDPSDGADSSVRSR